VDCGVALVRQWSGGGAAVESVRQWIGVSAAVACSVESVRQWSVVEASVKWIQCGSRVELLRLRCVGAAVELCGSGVS
jgi:hypothetical protein